MNGGSEAKGGASALGTRVLRALPKLSWTDGGGSHEIVLSRRVLVGSAPGAGLVLDDASVSRLHAELDPRPDGIWVRDLGSQRGTYLSTSPAREGGDAILVREARITLGRTIRFGAIEVAVGQVPEVGSIDLWRSERFGPMVGGTAVMRELFGELARLTQSDASVLVYGEPGVGKELVARALRAGSADATAPVTVVDCAVSPLAWEAEARGTVVLREVDALSAEAQAELLPLLPLARARVVSTTTRDLRRLVNLGAFDEGLYFQLAAAEVVVPPLRERREDIARLVAHFSASARETPSVDLIATLSSRPWLGNVRELRASVERAQSTADR